MIGTIHMHPPGSNLLAPGKHLGSPAVGLWGGHGIRSGHQDAQFVANIKAEKAPMRANRSGQPLEKQSFGFHYLRRKE